MRVLLLLCGTGSITKFRCLRLVVKWGNPASQTSNHAFHASFLFSVLVYLYTAPTGGPLYHTAFELERADAPYCAESVPKVAKDVILISEWHLTNKIMRFL